jgi:hypothetical protein
MSSRICKHIWYGANSKTFNNVMRQVDYAKDSCYLVIYGTNHLRFSNTFNGNPYFEVVDLDKVLNSVKKELQGSKVQQHK